MLQFSSFLNVFLWIGKNPPANIYFYIPKIATPKGARDTDTVNKEVEYSSIWGGRITNGHREIYIYNTVSNGWKECETGGMHTNLAA